MPLTRKKRPALLLSFVSLLCLATAMPSIAQEPQGSGHPQSHNGPPPMEHHSHKGHHGRWWDNPHLARKIGLTDAQKSRMDAIFEKDKPQLTSLNDTLKKEEATLHPLLQADKLDEHEILHQIDTIAQARANLEKANARMLFGLRRVLTPEQWKKLQAMSREWHMKHHDEHGPHGPDPSHDPGKGPPAPPPQSSNQ